MHSITKLIIPMLLIVLPVLQSNGQIYLTNQGTATFVSDASYELITATSENLKGAINLEDNRFVFKIDNKSFIGFNSALQQEHFYENYIETEKYKSSTFQGKIIEEIDLGQEVPLEIRAKGILSIHGIEQERIIKATIQKVEDRLIVNCDFVIALEDFNIRIPNVVYQKIAENISINITAELEENTH